MVALLRGINVGGNRKVPMSDLCAIANNARLTEVKSYINSGNIVFESGKLMADQVIELLENEIEKQFCFQVDVIVRTVAQWKQYTARNPFPSAARDRPHLLHLALAKLPFNKDSAKLLSGRALQGEKLKLVGDAIWVDFVTSVGKSKLSLAVFDKAAGSAVTLRNWNTLLKLGEMLIG